MSKALPFQATATSTAHLKGDLKKTAFEIAQQDNFFKGNESFEEELNNNFFESEHVDLAQALRDPEIDIGQA